MKTRCMCCGAERKAEPVTKAKGVYWTPRRCFSCCANDIVVELKKQKVESRVKKLSYLTEEEAKMPIKMALLQLTLGLQSCKTKGDAVDLLYDSFELGRRQELSKIDEIKQKLKVRTVSDLRYKRCFANERKINKALRKINNKNRSLALKK